MRPGITLLDMKLGLRMMARYPGLTVVGLLAMTIAIGITASWFEFTEDLFDPALPLEDADRVVALRNWDLEAGAWDRRALHDFTTWRTELSTVRLVGAATDLEQTVTTDEGRSATVAGSAMSAAGFQVARVEPLFGRTLTADDERAEAPPVVVLGHDLWLRLFDGDRGVLGREVRLGASVSTVVGVMPEGFGFPINQEIWTPFREDPLRHQRREGPPILIFGRLAPGASLEQAQRELTRLGEQAAAEFPEFNEQVRPRVEPYLDPMVQGNSTLQSAINVPFLLLLVVICTNVATLVFARTATRRRELVTRSALGASRGRLILQLFAEALVITSIAALLGLIAAAWGLGWGMDLFWQVQQSRPPFWFDPSLSLTTILYAAALAIVSAALIGAIPALKATGRNLRAAMTSMGDTSSRLRFGALSTGVIVLQVALCVVFLPIAAVRTLDATGSRLDRVDFPAEAYLSGRLTFSEDVTLAPSERLTDDELRSEAARLQGEVKRRLGDEPGVASVAFASRLPGMNHPYEWVRFEEPRISADSGMDAAARAVAVDLDFFAAMEASIIAGRAFAPSDLESGLDVAIVDRTFVQEILGGRSAVGHRFRYPSRDGDSEERWYEIVGVVDDLAMNEFGPGGFQDLVQMGPAGYLGIYHPLQLGEQTALQLFVRTEDSRSDAMAPDVEAIVSSLDPRLGVVDLMPLDDVWRPAHDGERLVTWILALVTAIVIGLSVAGIYALTSFAVSQRTREIGIRTALGAEPARLMFTIFSGALAQVGFGVLAGVLIFVAVGVRSEGAIWLVVGMAAAMLLVGLLACVPSARRALRVEPTVALRAEG